jgi:hypothetical protein
MQYLSKLTLLGLPLVHIAIGRGADGRYVRGIAKGWIAIGDVSFGVLLSVGGAAFGGITVGGVGLGVVTVGGLAIGALALGGLAIGVLAAGGAAIGWAAAFGGLAIAREYALGGEAIAQHANDQAARDYLSGNGFFATADTIMDYSFLFLFLALLPAVLALLNKTKHQHTPSTPS